MTCTCAPVNTVPLGEFAVLVMANIHGIAQNLAEQHALTAIIKLAKTASVMKRTVFVEAGDAQCFVNLEVCDPDVELRTVEEVWHPDTCRKLDAVRCVGDVDWTCNSYHFEKPSALLFNPPLACPGQLEVRAIVQPSKDACNIDECIFTEYEHEIADYATALALDMPSAPWYDPAAASLKMRRWSQVVREARTLEQRGRMAGPLKPRPVRFI